MLEAAAAAPQADTVEETVTAAHRIGLHSTFVPPLLALLRSHDHFRHEDIVAALQGIKDPRAIDALFEAASVRLPYLDYDEFFGLARKCTWALADIGTQEAKTRLEQLTSNDNRLIADYAKKRLDRWDQERDRKGA
jgi:HEAT repeat protein